MSVTESQKIHEPAEGGIEIRLSDIIQFLRLNKRRMLIGALIGLLIGALYAFSKPNVYKSQVTLMPEIQPKSSLGNLGSLASLAGISVDNLTGQDAIRPDLYPDVLQSVPFAIDILKQPVYSKKWGKEMTLEAYITEEGKGWLSQLTSNLSSSKSNEIEVADPKNFSQAIQLTKDQNSLITTLLKTIGAQYDRKTGMITIAATETDPVVAATVARLSVDYLTTYITTYRTEKSRRQVTFLIHQVKDAKTRYQAAEYALSTYRDKNRNLYLETAKIDEQRLQADYLLEQSVYNELSKQLEQAKIKLQEETPVFKVLEPPTIPLKKSGPGRTLIMAGFAIFGTVISLLLALRKQYQLFRSV